MTEQRWPGEDRVAAPNQQGVVPGTEPPSGGAEQDPGAEFSADEIAVEPGAEELAGSEAEVAPAEEQLDEEEAERETPVPERKDEPPAEEDELPRRREHAGGRLSIPDGYTVVTGSGDGARRTVGIVVSRFNGDVTNRLLESALDELELAGTARDAVTIIPVPGAFELPLAAMALAKTRRFACVIALGCVIRGETPHFDYVAGEAASGLQLAALETGIPVSFGVLTLESAAQAEERVGKGAEAVRSALEMADLFSRLRTGAQA